MTYSARVYYKHGQSDDGEPLIVATQHEMDAMLDALLAEPFENSIATMHVRERPRTDNGFPDHGLYFGVNAKSNVGSMCYYADEVWVSAGKPSERDEVWYLYMGHDLDFPRDSEIAVDDIRLALREFLASGGQRPTSVQWRAWPEGRII